MDEEPLMYHIPVAGEDVELHAIQIVAFAAEMLEREARPRVLRWALDRYLPDSSTAN
jgi:hypothetical protein